MKNKRKIRRRLGDIFSINMGDGTFCFGRVLERALMAFYDLKTRDIPDPEEIICAPIIFKICVMDYAVTSGRWPVIGSLPLTDDLCESVVFFRQDALNGKLTLYHEDGTEEPATYYDCIGLERAAVWDPEHVEDRLRDYYLGVPNKWFELMRPKDFSGKN